VVIVIHVVVLIAAATVPHLVQFAAPFLGFPAVFSVLVHCHAESLLRPVNISVALVLCPNRHR
jgi:hypothetical protein